MIIKLFRHKGPSASAVNYCMSDYDHTKKKREVSPRVLRGDPEYTKSLDKTTSKFSIQATSGVISFRDKENLTEGQKQKLIDDFEDTFIGTELKNKVNCLYIEHWDKGNLEIHFIINNVAIDTKPKYFNPFPPGHQKLSNAFAAKKNHEYGFEQIKQKSILSLQHSSNEKKALEAKKDTGQKHNFYNLKTKTDLHKFLTNEIKQGNINNRQELIEFIQNDLQLELSRVGTEYISIKSTDPNKQNIRLRGDIYSDKGDKPYKELQKSLIIKNNSFNIKEVNKIYVEEMSKRVIFNSKRYGTNDDPRGYDTSLSHSQAVKTMNEIKQQQEIKKEAKHKSATNTAEKTPKAITAAISPEHSAPMPTPSPSTENSIQADLEPQLNDQAQQNTDTGATLQISTSAQSQLAEALVQLANARTPEQKAKAEVAVAKAKVAAIREEAENKRRKDNLLAQAERIRISNMNNTRRKI